MLPYAAAESGMGIASVPDFIARPKVTAGTLVSMFEDYIPKDRGIYAIYPAPALSADQGAHLR